VISKSKKGYFTNIMNKPTLIYYTILKYQPENHGLLQEQFNVIELPSPRYDTPEALAQADVLLAPLGYFCGREKIDQAPDLKVIGSNTTGHPHIDVHYAKNRDIRVVTLKNERIFLNSITPTAELTWGLIIGLTRKIIPSFNSVLEGKWDRRPFGGRAMLSRMSLGIAGLGRLGEMVAKYGECFGMEGRYFDPFVDECSPRIHRVDSLEKLVRASDIVTVHIPHVPETENIFSRHIFSNFKKGSYFINTSRSELVDHIALLEFLENGHLAGAALDVFQNEFAAGFQIRDYSLWKYAREHDNLMLTPHIGGSTYDAWSLTERRTIDMIIEAI